MDVFKLEECGEHEYRTCKSETSPIGWSTNGVIIAQALGSANRCKPATMNLSSSHIYFFNHGEALLPMKFQVNVIEQTDSICVIEINASHGNCQILKAEFCFHKDVNESMESQCHMPATAVPKYCLPLFDALNNLMEEWEQTTNNSTSTTMRDYVQSIKINPINSIFDIRVVDGESFTATATKGYIIKLWAKANIENANSIENNMQLAAYFVETTLIPSMLRYHMSQGFLPTQILPVDFCCWFHRHEFTVNDWLLCENYFTVAKNGKAFIEHHVWTIQGDLVMTANSEAVITGEFVRTVTTSSK